MRRVAEYYRHLATTPWLLYPLLFVAGVLAAALPTTRAGIALPQEYDEFAYLLGADTFLQGRLTNPPHPLAPFFETMHELQSPTYASKYPPGQSLQLALGELLGHPIFGVWVTVGLLSVAAAWMLRGLAPATWAAAGGLVAAWQWGALTYWGHSYWGGSLFALAGMLVFGGAVRFWRKPGISAAWWAGVGAGIMALTRPYEGLWFCLVPAGVMAWRLVNWEIESGGLKDKICIVIAGLLAVAAALAFLLIYNHAVTGNAFQFPHRLYQQQAEPDVSVFVWEHPGPAPQDRNPELTYQIRRFNPATMLAPSVSLAEAMKAHLELVPLRIGGFFLQGLLGIGAAWATLEALFSIGRRRKWRSAGWLAWASMASFFIMLGTLRFFGFPHYAAAWAAPLAALILLGFRGLCAMRMGRWRLPPWVVAIAVVGWSVGTLVTETARGDPPKLWVLDRWQTLGDLEHQSETDHRGHVVFVMMAEGQPAFAEWVYNGPDIDQQTVVFARSLGAARDVEVQKYYPNRHLWQAWLKPSGELARLTPYDPGAKTLPAPAATKD
jgi:hypothetical protein